MTKKLEENKYSKWYFSIIDNAKINNINENEYYEIHHIIPKCMNGSDDSDNLVKLTTREYFICHWLLTKMAVKQYNDKILCAFRMMAPDPLGKRYNRSKSKIYAITRERFAKMMEGNDFAAGSKWFNNGIIEKMCHEPPENWIRGRLKFKRNKT